MVEHSLRDATTLSHIVGTACSALYSFINRGLRESSNIRTIKGVCKYYKGYMHMCISNDQVLAIALLLKGVNSLATTN